MDFNMVATVKIMPEGVETEGHVAFLKDRHCDIAQGYHFGRPLPPDEAIKPYFKSDDT